jgi:hypothetical protein
LKHYEKSENLWTEEANLLRGEKGYHDTNKAIPIQQIISKNSVEGVPFLLPILNICNNRWMFPHINSHSQIRE